MGKRVPLGCLTEGVGWIQTCCTVVVQQSWEMCVIWGSQMSQCLWEGKEGRDHTNYLGCLWHCVHTWSKIYYRKHFHGNCNLMGQHDPQPLSGLLRRISGCRFLWVPPKNPQWNIDVFMSVMAPAPFQCLRGTSYPGLQTQNLLHGRKRCLAGGQRRLPWAGTASRGLFQNAGPLPTHHDYSLAPAGLVQSGKSEAWSKFSSSPVNSPVER